MSDSAPDPPQRRSRSLLRIGDLPAWTGAVGTVVAVVAAVIAYQQVHLADVQNESAERDSLVTLVSDVAQVTRNLATAPPSQDVAFNEQRLADAAQGLELVNALHGHVPAIDNFELGVAFQGSGEHANALESYQRAAVAGDPHYRASAFRALAGILYRLGGAADVRQAEIDTREAYSAYDGQADVSQAQNDGNKLNTDLLDVPRLAALPDCARARSELAQAKHLIAADPAASDYIFRSNFDSELSAAPIAIKEHCRTT